MAPRFPPRTDLPARPARHRLPPHLGLLRGAQGTRLHPNRLCRVGLGGRTPPGPLRRRLLGALPFARSHRRAVARGARGDDRVLRAALAFLRRWCGRPRHTGRRGDPSGHCAGHAETHPGEPRRRARAGDAALRAGWRRGRAPGPAGRRVAGRAAGCDHMGDDRDRLPGRHRAPRIGAPAAGNRGAPARRHRGPGRAGWEPVRPWSDAGVRGDPGSRDRSGTPGDGRRGMVRHPRHGPY